MARALYDDEALVDMGSRIWDAGIIGGGAGGIVSVLTNLAIRGSTSGRGLAWGTEAAAEDALQRQHNLNGGRRSLAQRRDRTEGVPEASEETRETNRRKLHLEALMADQARLNKQAGQESNVATGDDGFTYYELPDGSWVDNIDPAYGVDISFKDKAELERAYADAQLSITYSTEVVGEPFVPLTPEQVKVEVEKRVAEDKAKEAAGDAEAQEAETRAVEDAGATFLELDRLSDLTAEEIMDLFRGGQITAEAFDALLLADRLSNLGGASRDELQEFARRNAEVINRYDSSLVATAILAGHPSIDTEKETSSDLFGKGSEMAVGMLAPLLSPESQVLLGQPSLSPAEINIIVREISAGIKDFDATETDRLIYDFRGNTDLYERVNRNYQERSVEWRQGDENQLELHLSNPDEQEAVASIRETVAKAPDSWNNESTLRDNITRLLNLKNIVLNKNRKAGPVKFKSRAFMALMERVTGHTDLNELTPGQAKALYGHIANLPRFNRPTPLPDLSVRDYSPIQAAALLERLAMAHAKGTETGKDADKLVDAFGQIGITPDETTVLEPLGEMDLESKIESVRDYSPTVEPLGDMDQANQLVSTWLKRDTLPSKRLVRRQSC